MGLDSIEGNSIMKNLISLFAALLCLANIFAVANEQNYPQEALQCYASSALQSQKEGKIICPVGSQVCIKQVINTTSRADCGTIEGTHFGRDVWDRKLAQCVYRKCGSKCPSIDEDEARIFGGDTENGGTSSKLLGKMPTPVFNRTSYCCNTNLCNQASDKLDGWRTVSVLAMSIIWFA